MTENNEPDRDSNQNYDGDDEDVNDETSDTCKEVGNINGGGKAIERIVGFKTLCMICNAIKLFLVRNMFLLLRVTG